MATRLAARLLVPLLLAAAASAQAPSCRTYVSKGLIQPAVGSLQDVIVVQDAFVVDAASVTLDVSHRRIGALKISLGAQPFAATDGSAVPNRPQIILKSHGLGRRGSDLYRTTFSDAAATAFPANASYAPFTGSFRPVQKLAFLTDGDQQVAGSGGSQGLWTLTIADVAPNNTLREIALNGWTLQLCPRGAAPAPSPAPMPSPSPVASPSPVPTASPSPAVVAASGPPQAVPSPKPATTTVGGWTIVTKPTGALPADQGTAAAASPMPAPSGQPMFPGSGLGGVMQPMQQLLAQRPLLSMLEQQIQLIVTGTTTGQCGAECQQAKKNMWTASVTGLYLHGMSQAYHKHHPDAPTLLQKLMQMLPGDNPALAKLQTWMDEHKITLQPLGSFLHDHLKLPTITINGQPVTLGSGHEALKELLHNKDALKKLGQAFAAAGQRVAQLASSLASHSADSFQGIMSGLEALKDKVPAPGSGILLQKMGDSFANVQAGLAGLGIQPGAKLAQLAAAQQAAVGGVAGSLDNKLTGLNQFLTSMNGATVDQAAQASLAELSSSLSGLFDLSSFS